MKSLDALISYLLEQVALCGKQGRSHFPYFAALFHVFNFHLVLRVRYGGGDKVTNIFSIFFFSTDSGYHLLIPPQHLTYSFNQELGHPRYLNM